MKAVEISPPLPKAKLFSRLLMCDFSIDPTKWLDVERSFLGCVGIRAIPPLTR